MKKNGLSSIFVRSMKVMDKRLFIYLSGILFMSVSFSLFGVMEGLLMKAVVDIAQSRQYERLIPTVGFIVLSGILSLLVYRKAIPRLADLRQSIRYMGDSPTNF